MKTIFHTLTLLVISLSLHAQSNGEIKGKILDTLTKQPVFLANAYVENIGSFIGERTDDAGRFTIKPLNAGVYDLVVTMVGYKKYVLEDVRVNSGKITFLKDIFISPSLTLDSLIITAERYEGKERLIKPDDPTVMTILAKEIKQNPLCKMPKELIANLVPGIHQADHGQPLYFRGSRSDAVQYIVDGVKTRNGMLGIPGCSIGEIDVYTGGVPAMYGDLTGGAVVIETKSFFEMYSIGHNTSEY